MRWLAILAVGLALSVQSVGAQGGERTLLDMTVLVTPPDASQQCVDLPAGTLTASLQWAGNLDGPTWPVQFHWLGYRGSDPSASLTLVTTRSGVSSSVPLQGGVYCYGVQNMVNVAPDAPLFTLTQYTQPVALRLTLTR
jgi:hypothetical protein